MANVGNIIKKLREDKGLTQIRLSLQSGISQSYLSQIENGERRLKWEEAQKIAKGLGVSIAEFETLNPMPSAQDREKAS